jgi:UDP-N-acetyl-D-glucosamine dehydrogenase
MDGGKPLSQLVTKINNKTVKIGIVGLGYVGFPLAVAFSESGFQVLGFDIEKNKVDFVNQRKSYVAEVSSGSLLSVRNRLKATTNQSRLNEVDAIYICVPTPLTKTKEPDLSHVVRESEEVSKYLKPGQLVVLESTTYPGTTRGVVLPILERLGLKAGIDFYLAFSPERIDPGSKKYSLKNIPKIVGGLDTESTMIAALLYRQIVDVVATVSCPEVAEMAKVFENVFRNVNIALVNELAQLCERLGISVWEVIDAAATKPFGYMPFYPGPGVGGHCIPLDPHYLANKAREYDFHTRFIQLAAEINEQMPYHIVSRITEALNGQRKALNGAKLLLLGVTYKKDVADIRESPSLKLIQLLQQKGAKINYNDPYIPQIRLPNIHLESVDITEEFLSSMDCTVIATDHSCYNIEQIANWSKLVFDTRGITRMLKVSNIARLGE